VKARVRDGQIVDATTGVIIDTKPNRLTLLRVLGWDILDRCKAAGFHSATMIFHASRRLGIVGGDPAGILVLKAVR
jgi:hypothetical protein